MDEHDHSNFVTKEDLKEAFTSFEERITLQHEKRIGIISGHYTDLLKSNQDLHREVAKLIESLQPILDAQKLFVTLHGFFRWLGIPFATVLVAAYWVWNKINS